MPARSHAAWDRITATRRGLRFRAVTSHELREHAADRTAFLRPPQADPPGAVRAEYERRTPEGWAEPPWPYGPVMWALVVLINAAALTIGAISAGTGFEWRVLIFPIMSGGLLLAMCAWRRSLLPARRLAVRRCPDCNADLSASHADAPLDPASLGIDLGPQHCPNCGAFWPLVPPAERKP